MDRQKVKSKDLVSISDLSPNEIMEIINRTRALKGQRTQSLKEKVLALVFEKPSLRTRVSFEVAMDHLGGHTIYLSPAEIGIGKREPIEDIAQVLSRYVDAISIRAFSHNTITEFAKYSDVPVINALSDVEHPCQALADLVTIMEKVGKLEGASVAFIGDGNNVASSLCLAAIAVGSKFTIASPSGYNLPKNISDKAKIMAKKTGGNFQALENPEQATKDADVVYTDVWVSMGDEGSTDQRLVDFARYSVDEKIMQNASSKAILMHPMPAHYGQELPKGFLSKPFSAAYDQAENRLHVQKAILDSMIAN